MQFIKLRALDKNLLLSEGRKHLPQREPKSQPRKTLRPSECSMCVRRVSAWTSDTLPCSSQHSRVPWQLVCRALVPEGCWPCWALAPEGTRCFGWRMEPVTASGAIPQWSHPGGGAGSPAQPWERKLLVRREGEEAASSKMALTLNFSLPHRQHCPSRGAGTRSSRDIAQH